MSVPPVRDRVVCCQCECVYIRLRGAEAVRARDQASHSGVPMVELITLAASGDPVLREIASAYAKGSTLRDLVLQLGSTPPVPIVSSSSPEEGRGYGGREEPKTPHQNQP